MRRRFRRAGWGLVLLAVAAVAVLVPVGTFRAHGQDAFNRWAGWAAVAAVVLAAVQIVLALLERREGRAGRDRASRERVSRLLVRGSPAGLPRLSEIPDDQLGVTPTRYSIGGQAPYVARPEADQVIRGRLAEPGPPYPFVLVWGNTKTGKSRTLAEALHSAFAADPVVVLPAGAQSLPELDHLGVDQMAGQRPAVVVLDDLDAAGLESLTAEVLTRVRGWAVIAATMTAERRAEVLSTSGGVGTTARAALAAVSGEYELAPGALSGDERSEAERLYPAERFDGGIAETLVGARELIARYRAGPDTSPAGCALVRAAIDMRRQGVVSGCVVCTWFGSV